MAAATRRSTRASSSNKRKAPSDADAGDDASLSAVETPTQRRRKTEAAAAAESERAAGLPTWVHSLFSPAQREQWRAFVRTSCLARVSDDFFDVFELAHSLSHDEPLGASCA